MKISLATHGGQLAGMHLHSPPQVVDTDTLSTEAAEELARLVAAAKAAPSKEPRSGLARDEMTYTITVDGDPPIVLVRSDLTMSPAFVALRNWIKKRSATK